MKARRSPRPQRPGWVTQGGRLLALLALCAALLQAVFALRIGLMAVVDPASTSFERSEAWRLLTERHRILWSQQWVDLQHIGRPLQRAVIASEDAGFTDHSGVDWDAIEKAWEKNQRSDQRTVARPAPVAPGGRPARPASARLVGGSTITQQLAKNLLLSGERTVARKAQELVITFLLETLLSKQRILEIYLNHVEWGEGVFGAQAAARHYFRLDAARLPPEAAARLAVMLPAPKRFEARPASAYLLGRAATVMARMGAVELP
jgi:monofunctional biosynthetic peptidoglycan transglycosylase